MSDKNKILLGMSGGVDSSTAIILLKEKDYDVEALTFIQNSKFDPQDLEFIEDAKKTAKYFNLKHHIIDISDEFSQKVISYFIEEYYKGRTPNPCAYCNPNIKFKVLLEYANKFNISKIATGHYAKVMFNDNLKQNIIAKAKDSSKDQTYFLWGLTKEQISRIEFPLGNYLKSEIREIANNSNIPIKSKPDSQEICFIPDNDYRKFLINNSVKCRNISKGDFIFHDIKKGIHNGYPFYTVGQRKGLGVSHSEPLYIKSINAKENKIYLETIDNLANSKIEIINFNFTCDFPILKDKIYTVKIRYRDPGNEAYCSIVNDKLIIEFIKPKNSIAIGQSAVIYDENILLGGGIIDKVY